MKVPNYEGYLYYYFSYSFITNKLDPLFQRSSQRSSALHFAVMSEKEEFNISSQRVSEAQFQKNMETTLGREIVTSNISSEKRNYFESGITSYIYAFSHFVPDVNSKLQNDVSPIVLAYIDGGISLPGYFLNFRYETDFGYRGGEVKTGREAKDAFNLSDTANYLLEAALGYNGVEVSYLTEHYQFGNSTYSYTELLNDVNIESEEDIKFESKRRQIDVKYHLNWRNIPRLGGTAKRKQVHDFYFGYRYAHIKTLKIIYTAKHESGKDPLVIGRIQSAVN
jgi:hypothetical protein